MLNGSKSHTYGCTEICAKNSMNKINKVSSIDVCFETVDNNIPNTCKFKRFKHLHIYSVLSQSSITHSFYINKVQKCEYVKEA